MHKHSRQTKMLSSIRKQHSAITRPITFGLLCFVAMVYTASFPTGVYNEYVYQYKVDITSGPQGFRFETKASLEILYTAKQSHQEAFNLIDSNHHELRFDIGQDDTQCHIDSFLVRLSLHEPKFITNDQTPADSRTEQPLIIDSAKFDTNIYNPDHSLYAHLLVLSNGTTLVKEIYTHQADTTTFKNIKKSILLNLLPTEHSLRASSATSTSNAANEPLFVHDNSIDQPELFSPDSISRVRIVARPAQQLGAATKGSAGGKRETSATTTTKPPANLPTVFKTIEGEQNVTFKSRVFAQAESNLSTRFSLELLEELKSDAHEKFDEAQTISIALKRLLADNKAYQLDTSQLEREKKICSTHRCAKPLAQLFKDYRDSLKADSMATVDASVAFLRLLERLRQAQGSSVPEILNVLRQQTSSKRADDASFLDILAAARTRDSIQAAMKHLKLAKVIDRDLATPERFLSVLSVTARTASKMHLKRALKSPHYFTPTNALKQSQAAKRRTAEVASFEFIASEFLKLFEQVPSQKWRSEKLRWSSLLTLATLVNAHNHETGRLEASDALNSRVNQLLLEELRSCGGGGSSSAGSSATDCRVVVMQAIGNVGHLGAEQFAVLRQQVLDSGRRESNTAMKILLDLLQTRPNVDDSMPVDLVNGLRDLLRRIVYDDKQESTARVLAAEMIVRFVPNSINIDEMLENLPWFKNNELATMIYSRIKSLRPESINKHHDWYWRSCVINGTSQSFVKPMARTESLNASYGVNLELVGKGKVMRESSFDVLLDTKQRTQDLFSLGVFSEGFKQLADGDYISFVWRFLKGGGSDNDAVESEMAGMSLKLMGGYLRPYVFFTTLRELYDHYHDGTVSDWTTIYMGNLLLIDHDEGYPLVSGFVAEQQMRGVLSIHVEGRIEAEFSLFRREAQAAIRIKAAAIVQSSQAVFTSLDKLWQAHLFSFGAQAKIDFSADAYFSAMQACLRVAQPEFKVRYHSRRHEQRMSDEVRRKVMRESFSVEGRSFPLSSDNDSTCSKMVLPEL